MNNALAQFLVLLGGIITIAIVAVIVSQKSNTSNVITSFFNGFNGSIAAAVSPITGGGASLSTGLGTGNLNNLGIG